MALTILILTSEYFLCRKAAMLRTTITWTSDYVNFSSAVLDIVNIKGGRRATYQLHLQDSRGIWGSMGRLTSYPNWSESVLALALRAVCKIKWGGQNIPESPLPSSGILMMEVSVGISRHGVEPLTELEAVCVFVDGNIAACRYRYGNVTATAWSFKLMPGDSDPYHFAAHVLSETLRDSTPLTSLPSPVRVLTYEYGGIPYIRVSELPHSAGAALLIHLQDTTGLHVPGECPGDCVRLQDWEDFLHA
jgi:hypothetical protein